MLCRAAGQAKATPLLLHYEAGGYNCLHQDAIRAKRGEAVIFTTRNRLVKGARGFHRANIKHGVSPLLSGMRYTLGIIYHDAR